MKELGVQGQGNPILDEVDDEDVEKHIDLFSLLGKRLVMWPFLTPLKAHE